jgi:hypothetical protein
MLAYLLFGALTICDPAPHTVLAVDAHGVPVFVSSRQINELSYLRTVKHFRELPWPTKKTDRVKPTPLESPVIVRSKGVGSFLFDLERIPPTNPAAYFETTDVYKVWFVRQSLPLLAQAARDPLGLSPDDRKHYDEHIRAGDRSLIIGYICAGLGILILIVGVGMMIYRDRMRKRKSSGD